TLGVEGAMPTLFNIFVSALALDNPAAPTSVNVAVQDDRSAIVTWSYGTPPVDFDGFTVKASPGTSYDDGSAIELSSGRVYEREISTTAINAPGNWTVAVFAHDTFGNVSDAGTYTVAVSAVPAPSALVATQTVNGVELGWTPPAGDVGLYYEVREGAVWGSATPIVKNHRSSSLFITLYDALQHTYQVAAIDRFGNYSTPIVVVSGVSSPASLTQFSATAQGDRVFFNWSTVEGIDIEYEVRRGESFDAGVQVFRTAGNSFDIMYPAAGTHTFWIKARSKVGLYSPSAIFATARIAPISSRNILYEQDYYANGFPGQRYNFELVTVGGDDVLRVVKDGGINRQQAIYFDAVNLPARMFTRTWLDGVIGVSGDSPQWDEATFAWEDPEAEQAWSPLLQLGAGVQQDIIALDTAVADLPSTLIDAFTLNETTAGLKGTTAASASGIAYATARYLKGARIENGDALGWNIASTSDPWTVTFDICLPDATTTLGQREIARFTAGGSTFYVRYNDATSALTLTRDAGLETLSVTLDLVASDVVKLCVAQSATGRLLAAYSRESDSLVSDAGAHVSPGALSAVNFHPVNNATYDSANAVIGDVEVWDVAFTLSEFTEDMSVEFIRPAGYDDFAAFKSGDYEFENAIIGLRLVPDDPNSDFVIQRAKVVCDVEDVIDRGTEALSSGWNVITFARNFNVAPEVTATVIAGAAPASAEIRNVTTTQFEIHLIRISDGADVAGSVSWAALGY
ncbi:MAG: hypothetical protein LPL29_14600, partial [Alphaproteobacteria bacterium]|nr:hypothetical protein [Alphaproteobacteria bacterium]